MKMTRLDFCDTIPITVQNIIIERMKERGVSRSDASRAVIEIASEMCSWGFIVESK